MAPKSKILPYSGAPSFPNSLKTSGRIRNINPIHYLLRRLFNHILLVLAFSCPINYWRVKFNKWRGVNIEKNVFIGLHVILDRSFPEYITLEAGAVLAGGNHLLCHSRPPEFYRGKLLSQVGPIHIKSNSWLTINVIVLPNVTIGSGSVVTAGSVVTHDIPDNVIARGNPAEIIKEFKNG